MPTDILTTSLNGSKHEAAEQYKELRVVMTFTVLQAFVALSTVGIGFEIFA